MRITRSGYTAWSSIKDIQMLLVLKPALSPLLQRSVSVVIVTDAAAAMCTLYNIDII